MLLTPSPRERYDDFMTRQSISLILLLLALSFHGPCFADGPPESKVDPYMQQIETTLKQTWKSPNGLNPISVISVPITIDSDGKVHVTDDPSAVEIKLESKQSAEIVSAVEQLKLPPPPGDKDTDFVFTFIPGINVIKVFDQSNSRAVDPDQVQNLQDLEDTLNATADTLDTVGNAYFLYELVKEKFLQFVLVIAIPLILLYALIRKFQKKPILPGKKKEL